MKKFVTLIVIAAVFLSGCATMVRIDTNVPDAKITINGQPVGTAPVTTSLSDAIWENYTFTIQKDGYKTVRGVLNKEFKVGTFIGGLFLWPLLLWTYGPQPFQTFELEKQ